ncbi:MAG: hypothetical protein NZ992_07350 [Candidatus Korarchaeum sp.]|nr:hypothetical protein [Candidatus Korarchaeum sp.]MDW8034876.1 hypothetical protein [Candidatus Korarchaeum sp.]
MKGKVLDYSPTLMLRFKSPSVLLRPSVAQLKVKPGSTVDLNISIEGQYHEDIKIKVNVFEKHGIPN